MLHDAFKRRRPTAVGDTLFLLDYIDKNISSDASISEWFITCFSENRDDLSQWRAYGDGENGYSIGFNSSGMMTDIMRNNCVLAPVQYDQTIHTRIVERVADATLQFFLQGWQTRRSSGITIDEWALSFLTEWVNDITYLAPAMKHPGFAPECEWRIIHRLQREDRDKMVYFQKETLMSRHLPLNYKSPDAPAGSKLLPIGEIMVGPSRHKQVTKISVADLLRTKGYPESKRNVTVSGIPFQLV
jgi:hypothetical protein